MTLSAILVSRDQHNNFVSIIVPLQGSWTLSEIRMEVKISLERKLAGHE